MSNSKIEWTEVTWSPVVGCSHTSPGCDNCYAERMAASGRLQQFERYRQVITDKKWNGKTVLHEETLLQPLYWRTPRMVFADSMTDLFHENLPFEMIDRVMAVIALCPQHKFQVLTKRADRMAEYFSGRRWGDIGQRMLADFANHPGYEKIKELAFRMVPQSQRNGDSDLEDLPSQWPLPNLWLGVTGENQKWLDIRWEYLKQVPAPVKFISHEPAIGRLILPEDFLALRQRGWFICGGESGPGARPMHPDWARGPRDQCSSAGLPFFFKQWGEYTPHGPGLVMKNDVVFLKDGTLMDVKDTTNDNWYDYYKTPTDCKWMKRVGREKAGCLLDGVEHKEYPNRKESTP